MLVFSLPLNAQFSPPCQLEGDFDVKAVKRNQMACSGSVVFELVDEQNGGFPLSISVASASGFTFASASYNPANGELEVSSINISAYNKIGNLWLEVETPNGICYLELNVVECCNELLASAPIVVNEDISTYVTGTSFTGNWVLMGDITFASGAIYDFDGASVYLGPDAQLLPETDVDLEIIDSDFEPFCDCRWDRILLPNSTRSLTSESSTFRGALRAIMAESEAEIDLLTSDFIDVLTAVALEDFTGAGPFNGSYLRMDGCRFDFTGDHQLVYCYDETLSRVDMDAFYPPSGNCTGNFYTVLSRNSDALKFGALTYMTNEFLQTVDPNGDYVSVYVEDAQMELLNNYFQESRVCGLSDARLVVEQNDFEGIGSAGARLDLYESSFYVYDNAFLRSSILLEDPSFVVPAPGLNAGGELLDNLMEESELKVDGNALDAKLRLFNNRIEFTPVFLENFDVGLNGNLIFHSNYLESDDPLYLVSLQNSDGANFSNNHIENLRFYTPDGSALYPGLNFNANEGALVANNYFENFNRGLELRGNCTNTDFTCNEFVNNFHAFYFVSVGMVDVNISDQGSSSEASGNCSNYYYAGGTFPYGESLAGDDVQTAVDWYMTPPLTCSATPQPNVDCECVYTSLSSVNRQGSSPSSDCIVPSSFKRNPRSTPEHLADSINIEKFSLYPNPATALVHIGIPENLVGSNLTVQDINGRITFQSSITINNLHLDISSYPSGVYIIKMENQTRKLLIQN